jgi:hypothetical protein
LHGRQPRGFKPEDIMKKILYSLMLASLLSACCDDHSELIPGQNFIPKDILDEIRNNGQIIYEGYNPPALSGRFLMSPVILVSSNFDDFAQPGYQFNDAIIEFSDFDPNTLTLKVSFTESSTSGEGKGSFISGQGNNFTVYVRIDTKDSQGHEFLQTDVYSGTLEPGGIRNLQRSVFMVDDKGDPNDDYIENGQGRLVRDGDGFSERL